MTLNNQNRELVVFLRFRAATHTSRVNWAEMVKNKSRQYLRIKFLALNADFGSSSPDPLRSMRPAHEGVKYK